MNRPEPGAELRRFREKRGLSLRELAGKVAFDWSYLAQVERGERPGSPLLAVLVDDALQANGELAAVFEDTHTERMAEADERMRDAGVIELPDSQPEPPRWSDAGSGPGWSGDWGGHDDPDQQP